MKPENAIKRIEQGKGIWCAWSYGKDDPRGVMIRHEEYVYFVPMEGYHCRIYSQISIPQRGMHPSSKMMNQQRYQNTDG